MFGEVHGKWKFGTTPGSAGAVLYSALRQGRERVDAPGSPFDKTVQMSCGGSDTMVEAKSLVWDVSLGREISIDPRDSGGKRN